MADALIGATIQIALEKALSLAAYRIDLLFGFKKDLDSMKRSLELIIAVLDDAEQRQGQNQAVQLWLNSLEGVAFDAENVLDEINYEFLRHEVESRNRLKRKVCCFFSFSNCITFRWRMASKIRDIKLKLININEEAHVLKLVVSSVQIAAALPAAATGDRTDRQTDFTIAPIIGRTKEESKIMEMLLSPSEKVVSILPVIGMGGLGKTTLAKSVYNKKQIDEYFDKRIWVCVSKEVKIVELFKLILVQLTQEKVEVDDRNVIVEKIRKQLGEKRYFLVLDDVWNDKGEFWNNIFDTFKGLNPTNGSWCLVTSRLHQWATTLSDVKPHFLEKLSYDDCWSIIKEKVIAREEAPKELEAIKDRVVKRCDGLPLAASVIGGLLRSNPKEEWLSIVEKIGDQSDVNQVLKLSFDYLSPASVKKCFAYCSIFPKDSMMQRDKLIELWMAEGFLLPNLKNETVMEKIGEKCIRVLLQSSLLEETGYSFHGQVCYKMHDLVHDLAESISKVKSINLDTDVRDDVNQVHYLIVSSSGEYSIELPKKISTSLRTLFLNSGISGKMLSMCQNLHVLDMSRAQIRELPTSIGKLIHLRLIDLSDSKIQTLPDSLCKLYNLQILRLIYCSSLNSLPKQMGNLISLRHLHFRKGKNFQMPLEMGRLTCLQTLEFFNVGREKGRQIEELGSLKHLKGKLEIRNLELVKGKEEAEKANLMGKADLFRLELLWSSTNREDDNSYQNDVLESLQPCPNLQELQIENFLGDQLPKWFMNLSTLVELKLSNCQRCRELPVALGQFPFLKILYLSGPENIECIGLSFYRSDYDNRSTRELFPALTTLILRGMKNLVEWVGVEVRSTTATTGGSGSEAEVVDVFPVLEYLTIDDCPQLTTVPSHFPSLKKLEINGNDHISVLKNILSKATATLSCLKIEGMAELTCVSDIVAAFPPTGAFQNLKELRLWSCPNLTSIIPEAQRKLFPSLTKLTLWDLKNLVEWVRAEARSTTTTTGGSGSEVEVVDVFSVLEELEIDDCPLLATAPSHFPSLKKLTICKNDHVLVVKNILSKATTTLSSLTISMAALTCLSDVVATPPPTGAFQSLTNLELSSCPNLTSIIPEALPNLTSLQRLWIYDCPGLTSLPERMLQSCTSLSSLLMGDCPNLVSFPVDLQQTPSLSWFYLRRCPKLKTNMTPKGFGFLTSLRELVIGPFSDDDDGGKENSSIYDEFDWSGLASSSTLWYLTLYGLPHMESLPHQLQYLTALTSLTLEGFGEIEALPDWLGNFASLKYLWLIDCKKLRYLPSMDAMRRLTKLEDLYVRGCPLLKRRCNPPQTCGPLCSSEWSKISHIPRRRFYD